MKAASATAARRKTAIESFGCAVNAIGPCQAGMSLFAVTRGQWSMIDAVLHVLDQVGPSALSLWTWSVAEYDVQVLTRLREDRRVTGGRLVIDGDYRNKNRNKNATTSDKNAGIIRDWKSSFGDGSVRYVTNHSKMARIQSAGGLKFLLRGSMNLNFNPRFENFDITEGGADYDLVERIEDELPMLGDNCTGKETWAASRVGEAFDAGQLALFSGLKVWAK